MSKRTASIEKSMRRIGTSNGLKPTSNDPVTLAVIKVHDCDFKAAEGAAEKKEARADPHFVELMKKADDIDPGSSDLIYDSGMTSMMVKVNQPRTRLDAAALKNELRKSGVDQATIDSCVLAATKEDKPARTITIVVRETE